MLPGLNPQQLSVVEAPINDDLVVIAGAGTGKTRVIVSRIKKLLSDPSVSPNQILAISFSRDTKKELDERLRRELGPVSGQIQVSTFNALGLRIISQYKQQAELRPNVKTLTEYDLYREFRVFFNEAYKFYPFVMIPEGDDESYEQCVKAGKSNNQKDFQLAQTMCDIWNNVLPNGISLPINIQNMPIDRRLLAQDFSLVFPRAVAPNLEAQYKHFFNLSAMPQWAENCRNLEFVHRYMLHNTLQMLDKMSDFTLAEQWKAALILNQGAFDVLGNCWQEINMWFNAQYKLGSNHHQFTRCSVRYTFSMQELFLYIFKRKESGAVPRIGADKLDYYNDPANFLESWQLAYPCDLMRLKALAPESMQSVLKCPFKKDLTKTLNEADAEALQEAIDAVEKQQKSLQEVVIADKQKAPEFFKFFIKGEDTRELVESAQDCSCTFCPFFLDWYELLFAIYEKWREASNYLDFPEQINRCVRLLAGFDFVRQTEQKKIRFIFVDEFQDTNNVQYELLCQLKITNLPPEQQNHLCVVGDDDQAIYGWRGANFKCLKDIKDYLGKQGSNFLSLTINYRSHQNILNLANSLVHNNSSRLMEKRLVCPLAFEYESSQTEHTEVGYDSSSPRVNIVGINSYRIEGMAVAQAITYLHDYMGLPYNDIAVLYRVNSISANVEFALRQQNIPYHIKEQSFATRASVRNAFAALRLALDPNDDEAFVLLACCLFGKKVEKLLSEMQKTQSKLIKKQERHALGDVEYDTVENKSTKGKTRSASVKLDDLVEFARIRINHKGITSLYQMVNDLAEKSQRVQPKSRDKDILNLLLPLCESIDDAQTWNDDLPLADSMLLILTRLGIKARYQKDVTDIVLNQDGDAFEAESDEWLNIVQLISIAETFAHSFLDKEDQSQQDAADSTISSNTSGALSIGALASSPSFTSTASNNALSFIDSSTKDSDSSQAIGTILPIKANDGSTLPTLSDKSYEVVDLAQYHVSSDAAVTDQPTQSSQTDPNEPRKLSAAEKLKKEIEQAKLMDPTIEADLEFYSDKITLMRSQVRKIIIQLDQHCGAPWAPPLRVLYEQLKQQRNESNNDKVNLLSIHGSKGKEFKAVIIIGFEKDLLPHYLSMKELDDDPEKLEEERRLAYVALTRAKRYLLVTFCRNRLKKLHVVRETGRSMFVNEALQGWSNLDTCDRPYKENLISERNFIEQDNVWIGRIDP